LADLLKAFSRAAAPMTKASYNADQLETFARSFSSRSFKCQMPEPVSFLLGKIETNRLWIRNVLTDVWSFLVDDSVKIQIYHILKD
jgi:hypothetical protein